MKTRMVPFARIVPRLRRIVRQVGIELGKKVGIAHGQYSGRDGQIGSRSGWSRPWSI